MKNKTISPSRTRCSFGCEKISGGRNSSVLPVAYSACTASAGAAPENSPSAEHNCVPGFFCPIPTAIAIHREIASDDGGDPRAARGEFRFAGLQETGTAGRRSVAAIGERMHHDVAHARGLGSLRQGDQMLVMAVHTAVGDQAKKMQSRCRERARMPRAEPDSARVSVRDRLVDPREILINDPPRAEIEMTNLGIPHLAFRQANIEAARAQRAAWDIADTARRETECARARWRRRSLSRCSCPPGLIPQPSRIRSITGPAMFANVATQRSRHKPVLALTSPQGGFYIGVVKWRNQLLALFCLIVFFAFGVFYFRNWVVQKPFGIILFVGEGLGPGRLAMTRIYAGGVDKPLNIDSLTYSALLKNYSNDSVTPDEAAAATALATGVKVNNGSVGIDAEGKALKNLIELAHESGRMTGLVTNASLTDATPASFYAHASSKDDRPSLAQELIEKGNVDLVLGGGSQDFLPISKGGHRADERDLLRELQDAGYDVVRSREELDAIPRWRQAKLFGLFSDAEFPFSEPEKTEADQPSLADMVRRGIELLQFNSGGYLLIVDAGLMRKAAQENNAQRTLAETVELDRAVAVAVEYAGAKSTILVCGDVAIGGLTLNGSPSRAVSGVALLAENAAGDFSLTWATGPAGGRPASTSASAPHHAAAIYARSAQKTTEDVVAFGAGLGADGLHGTVESTAIFEIIRDNL